MFDLRNHVSDYLRPGAPATKRAVDGLTLHIREGEILGLLGPNGCGKTTFVNMLIGALSATAGSIRVFGKDVRTSIAEIRQRIGFVPQFDVLFDELTVDEHILFFTRIKGVDPHREQAMMRAVVADVGLDGNARRYANNLSLGQRRRLSLAIALTGGSKLLLADEPSTSLDPASRRSLWSVISRVKRGRSILLTTHSMAEADVLCDRVAVMQEGSLRVVGKPADLKRTLGHGFRVEIAFKAGKGERAVAFVTKTLLGGKEPDAVSEKRAVWRVQRDEVVMSKVFAQLGLQATNYGIKQWGICPASLEEVFMDVVRSGMA